MVYELYLNIMLNDTYSISSIPGSRVSTGWLHRSDSGSAPKSLTEQLVDFVIPESRDLLEE